MVPQMVEPVGQPLPLKDTETRDPVARRVRERESRYGFVESCGEVKGEARDVMAEANRTSGARSCILKILE